MIQQVSMKCYLGLNCLEQSVVWCAVITAQEWTVKLLYNKLLYALSLNNPVNKSKNLNYRYPSYALITHTFWELTSEVKVSCAPIALLFSYFCWNCEFELSISRLNHTSQTASLCVCETTNIHLSNMFIPPLSKHNTIKHIWYNALHSRN